jgi:anti-anti-sigma factor
MVIDERRAGAVLVLAPCGRIDAHSAAGLQERLHAAAASGERAVLLDCGRVDYLSSAGLRALLTGSKRLAERDGRLGLCAAPPPIAEILRVSGFDTLFELYADTDAGLAALA